MLAAIVGVVDATASPCGVQWLHGPTYALRIAGTSGKTLSSGKAKVDLGQKWVGMRGYTICNPTKNQGREICAY